MDESDIVWRELYAKAALERDEARRQLAEGETLRAALAQECWDYRDRIGELADQLAEADTRFSNLHDEHKDAHDTIRQQKISQKQWRDAALERWDLWQTVLEENTLLQSQLKQSNEALSAAQMDLEAARKIVWLLIDVLRKQGPPWPWIMTEAANGYRALPRWLRKEIER